MAKRGRKKKFKVSFSVSPETYRSIVAVLLFLFSLVALVSFIAPDYTLNAQIQMVFRKAFGLSSLLLPVITAVVGSLFIDSFKHKVKELRVVIGLLIMLLALSGLFHVFLPLEEARQIAIDGRGGGFVGYTISTVLVSLISVYAAIPVFLALLIVGLIFVFDLSIDGIVLFFQEKLSFGTIFKGKDKNKDDDVVIQQGMGIDDSLIPEKPEDLVATNSSKDLEPTFEIVPSLSEPQDFSGATIPLMSSGELTSINPDLPYADKVWELPGQDLLSDDVAKPPDAGDLENSEKIIVDTLKSFGINVSIAERQVGPTVTKFFLDVPQGVKVAKISNLQYDLALALASPTGSVRIETPIPGTKYIGIEVPNVNRGMVDFKSLVTSDQMRKEKSKLQVILGKDVGGITHTYDISLMPHLLIAGATGSGKSVFIHNLILSILFRATPQEVKFILIDPKRVELSAYDGMPHLFTPIVTDIEKAPSVFKWAVTEMTRRLKLFESAKTRNIKAYNEKSGFQALPYIVIVVDELGEIMVADPASVEKSIIRLAQLARATGIHLVLAAQRPSANIITGLIKANIPCRTAFNVTGQVDSRVIIDQTGAEKLLGRGDMLFVPPDKPTPIRLQGAFITDKEISNVVNFLKGQGVPPEYREEILDMPSEDASGKSVAAGGDEVDTHYDEALEIIVSAGKASASLLQRRLSIGYARAARIIDELEQNGVVGPAQGSKPRDVLIDSVPMNDASDIGQIKTPQIRINEEEE